MMSSGLSWDSRAVGGVWDVRLWEKVGDMPAKTIRALGFLSSETDLESLQVALAEAEDKSLRFSLDTTDSYETAISAMVNNTHDVYLIDHLLPNCPTTGLELIERANAGGCNRPVILLTSMADEDVVWASEEAGAACFLNKQMDLSPRVLKHSLHHATSHFVRLKEIQYQLVLVRNQLSDVCRKLNRG